MIGTLLERVVGALTEVDGVLAVTLGGSRARGSARPDSDVDVGLYYRPDVPLDVSGLRWAAAAVDDRPSVEVTEPGAWGPWVDGGAWLSIDGHSVDWIYRNLDRVERYLTDAAAGRFEVGYQVGHPHGVTSAVYLGELATAVVLHDPSGALAAVREALQSYPPALRRALIERFGFEARFSLVQADKGAARGDVAYVVGCVWRATACLLQVAFAMNGRWLLNEKGALSEARSLPRMPDGMVDTVEAVLAAPGGTPEVLSVTVATVRRLLDAVETL